MNIPWTVNLKRSATPDVAQESATVVTSRLLEAFLACPTKCRLLSEGEFPAGTEYTEWAAAQGGILPA